MNPWLYSHESTTILPWIHGYIVRPYNQYSLHLEKFWNHFFLQRWTRMLTTEPKLPKILVVQLKQLSQLQMTMPPKQSLLTKWAQMKSQLSLQTFWLEYSLEGALQACLKRGSRLLCSTERSQKRCSQKRRSQKRCFSTKLIIFVMLCEAIVVSQKTVLSFSLASEWLMASFPPGISWQREESRRSWFPCQNFQFSRWIIMFHKGRSHGFFSQSFHRGHLWAPCFAIQSYAHLSRGHWNVTRGRFFVDWGFWAVRRMPRTGLILCQRLCATIDMYNIFRNL